MVSVDLGPLQEGALFDEATEGLLGDEPVVAPILLTGPRPPGRAGNGEDQLGPTIE
jgi:hypothetical protein